MFSLPTIEVDPDHRLWQRLFAGYFFLHSLISYTTINRH